MNILLLLVMLSLVGCIAVPVKRSFPAAPAEIQVACPELKQTDISTTKLSDVISLVAKNYGQYHECQAKVDSWIEWHKTQKTIFESVK